VKPFNSNPAVVADHVWPGYEYVTDVCVRSAPTPGSASRDDNVGLPPVDDGHCRQNGRFSSDEIDSMYGVDSVDSDDDLRFPLPR
jgi:hypothetical protein